MHYSAVLLGLAALTSQVYGHGLITTPVARVGGAAYKAACGTATADGNTKDNTTFIEVLTKLATGTETGFHADQCNLFLCKGYQFADNGANVHQYKTGDVVPISLFIRIPHKGNANVSVVDTTTNTVIGKPLISWDNYLGDGANAVYPKNNTDFSITIPELNGKCTQAGRCVIQWYWYSFPGIPETYESCLDFVVPANKTMRRVRA